jgi:hypothetical protein
MITTTLSSQANLLEAITMEQNKDRPVCHNKVLPQGAYRTNVLIYPSPSIILAKVLSDSTEKRYHLDTSFKRGRIK